MQEGALINPLFQPDCLAPAQFEETMRRAAPLEPEKRLMVAVLEDAVMCFQDNLFTRNKKKRQLFVETEQWLFEEHSDRLFAFETVCHSLNLDPRYVRAGLSQWRENRLKKQPSSSSYCFTAQRSVARPRRKLKVAVRLKKYHAGRNLTHAPLSRLR